MATRSAVLRHAERGELDRAVRSGDVVVNGRGTYALPHADQALRAAHQVNGVVSYRSAAAHWGWAQKALPTKPEITVPKNRVVSPDSRRRLSLHWADLPAADVDGFVTSRERTIVDVLRSLPDEERLPISDSALRVGDFTAESLCRLASSTRGSGCAQIRRIAAMANGLAANPLESVLRLLAVEAGLDVRPQVPIYGAGFLGQPDLVDVDRRIILEADSFEWHGNRAALVRDTRRYNAFVVHGWLVLRFSWEDVMHHPDYVRRTIAALAQAGTEVG